MREWLFKAQLVNNAFSVVSGRQAHHAAMLFISLRETIRDTIMSQNIIVSIFFSSLDLCSAIKKVSSLVVVDLPSFHVLFKMSTEMGTC